MGASHPVLKPRNGGLAEADRAAQTDRGNDALPGPQPDRRLGAAEMTGQVTGRQERLFQELVVPFIEDPRLGNPLQAPDVRPCVSVMEVRTPDRRKPRVAQDTARGVRVERPVAR